MNFNHPIRQKASETGFSYCGFARCEPLEELRPFYSEYLGRQGHAGFSYIERNLRKRIDPRIILPGAKSVISLLLNYFPADHLPETDNYIISKYAYGADYHSLMKHKMNQLTETISAISPDAESRCFVDSGVVSEKSWAQRCGVGWQGKNTLLINKLSGSYFFIGIILTSLELEPDTPETDHCGECRRCIDACPTNALHQPYQLDIRRCISYYTIERKEPVPPGLAGKFHDRVYGCDICQDCCPYNRFATPSGIPEFSLKPELVTMRKADWEQLSQEQFQMLFAGTSVERTGYEHFMRMIRLNHELSSPQ